MDFTDFLDSGQYPWLVITIAGAVAIIAAFAVYAALYPVLKRVTRFSVTLSSIVASTVAPARLLLPVLGVNAVLDGAPEDLAHKAAVDHAATLFVIAALTWLAVGAIRGVRHAVLELHPANISDNLHARRIETQTHVLARTAMFVVILIGSASALMTFPGMRHIGTSLLASAGVAGIAAGLAARPVLGSLIAGLQIALTQPIRLDDVVIMEKEWGRVEEITASYVVVKTWDERRLIVPLQWVIEHPFQNWTRSGSQLLGYVMLWVDFRMPLSPLRAELERVCKAAPEWDGRVALLQTSDANERAMQVRALVSAADSGKQWDLTCRVREALIEFIQREYPGALPHARNEVHQAEEPHSSAAPAPPPLKPGKGQSTSIQ